MSEELGGVVDEDAIVICVPGRWAVVPFLGIRYGKAEVGYVSG